VVYDVEPQNGASRRWRRGDGPGGGRELEIADILSCIKRAGISNTLWITAHVHYTARITTIPTRRGSGISKPFWEFVQVRAMPAASAEPARTHFGPQLMYVKAPNRELARAMGCSSFASRNRRANAVIDRDAEGRRRPSRVWSTTLERSWGDLTRPRLAGDGCGLRCR